MLLWTLKKHKFTLMLLDNVDGDWVEHDLDEKKRFGFSLKFPNAFFAFDWIRFLFEEKKCIKLITFDCIIIIWLVGYEKF